MDLEDSPLLTLVDRVIGGTMMINQGERAATDRAVISSLNPGLVGGISEASLDAAREGQWFKAQVVQRLLVAATEQLVDNVAVTNAYKMRQIAASDWVEIAHIALLEMPSPDGRLLVAARLRGERAVDRALQAGHPGMAGTLNFRLGTLHLDPYKARASPLTGPSQGRRPWQAALVAELGDTVLGVGRERWRMPDPVDALRYAADHLRSAFMAEGRHPGAAKALAQTLDAQMMLGETVEREELLIACRSALDALDPEADALIFEELSEILARHS